MIKKDSKSLSMSVFEELEEKILNGKIKPGENLTEIKLSSDIGVSRTPVREALRMLEQKNLVQITPNKGAIVLGINEKDLNDIYTIRMNIEGLGSRWTVENITDEQIKELKEIVELQEFYMMKNSLEQINQLDAKFHEKMYEYSNSRTLQHMLSDLHHMIKRYRKISFNSKGRTEKAIQEHREILEAVINHDPDAAERLTINHIINAKENLLKIIKTKVKN
ncbi:GntR family transcriptional regulator [Tissierella creatinophila]|uniref:HTH-type transcriptional regulator McbR n=1 Tax=Tissierella creatinophila DSM 6911 TaxID=1123403 RepID=A0A1U7M6F9_TISCR|nr:GntR family transcriptional regulator [Tissierella creatinophila]OLS02840.1 HTH-type transcriptional regulator McbR [Tissierella creatinophila DSM 6911]